MKRVFKLLVTVLSLPLVIGLTQGFYRELLTVGRLKSQHYYFIFGFFLYLLIQVCLFKPLRTYVFGHELTHLLWSVLFGGKVKSFKVSKTGGRVLLTRTNLIVRLAPYFFPLYSFLVVLLYYLLNLFVSMEQYHSCLLFLLGFTLAFHLALTLYAIRQGQKDIQQGGSFFSLVIVFMINIIVIMMIMKIVFPAEISLKDFFFYGWFYSYFIYKQVAGFVAGRIA